VKKPVGREYDGPSGAGSDSPWLTAEDLIKGKDLKVTIEKVIYYDEIEFEVGRKEKNKLALKFRGKTKELVLNATNRRSCVRMFGGITGGWKGQPIVLFVSQTRKPGSRAGDDEMVDCIRIRVAGTRALTAAEEALADPEPNGLERAAYLEARGKEIMQELEAEAFDISEAPAEYDKRMQAAAEKYDAEHGN
jgi:hypothetical protein